MARALVNSNAGTPSGAVEAFATSTPPSGWVKCNGASLLRSEYPALFSKIGITYGQGNDPGNTFQVPDLREEFVRGWADGKTGGSDSGRVFGSWQADQFKSHSHTQELTTQYSGTPHTSEVRASSSGTAVSIRTGGAINNTGGSDTRPKNVAMLFCIKV